MIYFSEAQSSCVIVEERKEWILKIMMHLAEDNVMGLD